MRIRTEFDRIQDYIQYRRRRWQQKKQSYGNTHQTFGGKNKSVPGKQRATNVKRNPGYDRWRS